METKDLIAIVLSLAAIAISILAWRTANASFRLAQAQDLRAQDREKPLLEIDLPDFVGRGPFDVAYKVTNRGEEPIQIVGFRLPISLGTSPLTRRAPFRFADTVDAERVILKPTGDEAGDYELTQVRKNLEPGESFADRMTVVPEPRDRVRLGTELRMYLDVAVRNREATSYSLPIRRKL